MGCQACLDVLAVPFAVSEILCHPVIEPELSHTCRPTVCLPWPSRQLVCHPAGVKGTLSLLIIYVVLHF